MLNNDKKIKPAVKLAEMQESRAHFYEVFKTLKNPTLNELINFYTALITFVDYSETNNFLLKLDANVKILAHHNLLFYAIKLHKTSSFGLSTIGFGAMYHNIKNELLNLKKFLKDNF